MAKLTLNRTEASKGAPLRHLKEAAHNRITFVADQLRRKFVTPITGQELTYQEKERQAEAYVIATSEPDPTDPDDQRDFGFIFGEVGITGQTPFQVATIILYKRDAMRMIGPAIERLRLKASFDVDMSAAEVEIDQIVNDYEEDMKAMENL